MNTYPDLLRRRRPLLRRLFQAVLVSASLTTAIAPGLVAAEASATAPGVVTGIVTNKTTGNGLIGARVEIPTLNRNALVDDTGRFILNGIPAGSHEVVVTYSGLDTQRTTVNVPSGQAVLANFEMSSSILMLDAFKVASDDPTIQALYKKFDIDNRYASGEDFRKALLANGARMTPVIKQIGLQAK